MKEIVFLFVLSALNFSVGKVLEDGLQEKCISVISPAIERINTALEAENFSLISSEILVVPGVLKKNPYRDDLIQFGGFKTDFEITLKREDFTIYEFIRTAFFRVPKKLYNAAPPPKWQLEKVVTFSEKLIKAVLTKKIYYGRPTAKFSTQVNGSQYSDGVWRVTWPRTSEMGYPFVRDTMQLLLTETYGPYAFACNFFSHYEERKINPLEKKRFLETALGKAQDIMNSAESSGKFSDHKIVHYSTELKVVNPKEGIKLNPKQNHDARLAWVFEYKMLYSGPKRNGMHIPESYIQVWFDAENGKYLGGDFGL